MKVLLDQIERVKGKPHHVRRQVALGSATAITAVIAFIWLAVSVNTGSFALKSTSFADASEPSPVVTTTESNAAQNVAGVDSVFDSRAAAPAKIEIVDTGPAKVQKSEPTTIPF